MSPHDARAKALIDSVQSELTPIWLGNRQRMVLEQAIAAALREVEQATWEQAAKELCPEAMPCRHPVTVSKRGPTMSTRLTRHWWIISVHGYGEFSFFGTEQQAEDVRCHKANWEHAVATKRRGRLVTRC